MKIIYLYIFPFVLFIALYIYPIYSRESMKSYTPTLKINLQQGDPLTLHPHLGVIHNCRIFGKALFEGLTRINEKNQVELAAAEKIEISSDKLQYTFTIRHHLWSNGKPVTAHHFEKAWKQALSPNGRCARADLFYIIKNAEKAKQGKISIDQIGVKTLNEHVLIVNLEHPAPYFLDLLASSIYSPLFDEEMEPKAFNGPFKLETWRRDVDLSFVRNPLYWDKDKVKTERIVCSMVKDPSVALSLFEKGEIDLIGEPFSLLPTEALIATTFIDRIKFKEISRTYWIWFNTEKVPYNSTKIRKALSYVINRRELIDHLLIGQSPHRSPVPKNLSLLSEEELYKDADTIQALKLFDEGLKELGLSRDTLPPFVLSHSNLPGQKSLAEAIQQTWQKHFGIKVVLEGSEWNTFFARINQHQFQLGGCLYSSLYNDPFYHLEMFKEKNSSFNASSWENETFKQCLDLATASHDESQRKEHLKEAEKILLEEMPVIPIFNETFKYMMNDKFEDLVIDSSGILDLKRVRLKSN